MTDKILDVIDQTLLSPLKEILQVWDYIGYDEDQRQKRISQLNEKLKSTISDFLRGENQERISIESELEKYKRDCTELSNSLELPAFFPPRTLSIYESIKQYKEKHEELEIMKNERLEAYTKSLENVKKFTRLLSKDIGEYDSSIQKRLTDSPNNNNNDQTDDQKNASHILQIPNQDFLEKLETLENQLDNEYTPLFEQYTNYCQSIAKIAKDFGYCPTNELEAQILKNQGITNIEIQRPSTPGVVRSNMIAKQVDFKDARLDMNSGQSCELSFDPESQLPIIKQELISFLKSWQSKLVKEKARVMGMCEELRNYLLLIWKRLSISPEHQDRILAECQSNTKGSLDILREEMSNCDQLKWEQLNIYLEGIKKEYLQLIQLCCVEQNINFEELQIDTETLVCKIEREIDRLRILYDENREVFDSLIQYRKLWDDLYDVEKRIRDPAILSNRGGILLRTEKEKKGLLRDLKTTESTILENINQVNCNDLKQKQFFEELNFVNYASKRQKDYELMLKDISKSSRRISTAVSQKNGPPGAPS